MLTTIQQQRQECERLQSLPYVSRQSRYDISLLLQNPQIKLITGPRRAGKSIFALMMLKGQRFAYLNFDDPKLLTLWNEDLVMSALDSVYPGYQFLLLDEVQNLDGWDLWVAKLYRRGINLIITGSNAKMLSSEMATVLTGRYVEIEMLPFGLSETLCYSGIDASAIRPEQEADARIAYEEYLRLHNIYVEVKIDKSGNAIRNGRPTGRLWDGTISTDDSTLKPLRLKVRNICGDETVVVL